MGAARDDAAPPLPGPRRVASLQRRLLGWYAENRRDLPWRRTTDPYAVLVSEIMLQQTQVPRVVLRYEAFLQAFPTLEALAAAPLAEVLCIWRGLGYNNRAVRLRACAAAVCEAGGAGPASLPGDLSSLQVLPGIGPYTARAVLIFAANADLAAVDANVRRVLTHELALPADLTPRRLQAVADAALPHGCSRDWHNALMDYGSAVLTARATRIAPRSRQGAFEGSRRWQRSRLLGQVLDGGPQPLEGLASGLRLPAHEVAALVELLVRDGLLRWDDGLVVVA
jgi:A/G-specific adenine glycosylase